MFSRRFSAPCLKLCRIKESVGHAVVVVLSGVITLPVVMLEPVLDTISLRLPFRYPQ